MDPTKNTNCNPNKFTAEVAARRAANKKRLALKSKIQRITPPPREWIEAQCNGKGVILESRPRSAPVRGTGPEGLRW